MNTPSPPTIWTFAATNYLRGVFTQTRRAAIQPGGKGLHRVESCAHHQGATELICFPPSRFVQLTLGTFPPHSGISPSTIQNKLLESHRGFTHDNKAVNVYTENGTRLIAPSRSGRSFLSRLCQRKYLIHSFAVWRARKFVHLDMSGL